MKRKGIAYFFAGIASLCSIAIAALSFSFAWFKGLGDKIEQETLPGEIGLRGYFFAGSGTSIDDPYEIVTPINFYNLSRLQNYGIFTETTYFRIGHIFDEEDGYQCIDYETGDYVDYLDMEYFLEQNPSISIRPIGSESTPFHGHFEGNGIPIKNLKISGYPEDIGIFGYVAYDGYIEGLVCDTLTVESLGYAKIENDELTYKLFSENIEDIFNSASYLATNTNLDFYSFNGSSYIRAIPVPAKPGLKNINGVGGVRYQNINNNYITVSGSDLYKGYFVPTFPNRPEHPQSYTNNNYNNDGTCIFTGGVEDDPFTYTWSSSSPIIQESDALNLDLDDDGNKDSLLMINFDLLEQNGSGMFNTGDDVHLDVRLSLTASVEVDGIIYSRVIQSYLIEFYSNKARFSDDGGWEMRIYCNYATPTDSSHIETNYLHGNNIGFLVGHLDGTLTHSYVYDGKFIFNDPGYNPIKAETQTGLVGEVGTNVVNALDPDHKSVPHGEAGVMNFTRIYDGIRGDFSGGETVKGGLESGNRFVSYDTTINHKNDHSPDDSLFDNYKEYLRHRPESAGGQYFVGVSGSDSWSTWQDVTVPTPAPQDYNRVDFLFNNVIQDDRDAFGNVVTNRGMGIFKLVTPRNTSANSENYQYHVFDNMGDCVIEKGDPYDKVYFSTAEYDHTKTNIDTWGSGHIEPLVATALPDDTNVFTFDYPFSRDYNYLFRLDLTENVEGSTNNFMYDTNSTFLTNYLSSRLIDQFGRTIPHFDYRFGFMFKNAELDKTTGEDITVPFQSLSSYMPLGYPGSVTNYGGDGVYKGVVETKAVLDEIVSPGPNDCYLVNNSKVYYQWNGTKWNISIDAPLSGSYIKEVDNYTKLAEESPSTNDYYLVGGYPSYYKYNGSAWIQYLEDPSAIFYPSNSIVFDIDNDNGGNVSVIANKKNVSIYKFYKYRKTNNPSGSGYTPADATKLYTMKSENVAGLPEDSFRYFTYSYSDGYGTTETLAHVPDKSENDLLKDNGVLYAHIFYLPKLEDGWAYAIGSDESGAENKANLYYLAVQGQAEGNIGSKVAKVGNTLDDVDFLVDHPVKSDFVVTVKDDKETETKADDIIELSFNQTKVAKFNFTSDFNTTNGEFEVGATTSSGHNYINFLYDNESHRFITYLFAFDYKASPAFFVNNSRYSTNVSPTYTIIKKTV